MDHPTPPCDDPHYRHLQQHPQDYQYQCNSSSAAYLPHTPISSPLHSDGVSHINNGFRRGGAVVIPQTSPYPPPENNFSNSQHQHPPHSNNPANIGTLYRYALSPNESKFRLLNSESVSISAPSFNSPFVTDKDLNADVNAVSNSFQQSRPDDEGSPDNIYHINLKKICEIPGYDSTMNEAGASTMSSPSEGSNALNLSMQLPQSIPQPNMSPMYQLPIASPSIYQTMPPIQSPKVSPSIPQPLGSPMSQNSVPISQHSHFDSSVIRHTGDRNHYPVPPGGQFDGLNNTKLEYKHSPTGPTQIEKPSQIIVNGRILHNDTSTSGGISPATNQTQFQNQYTTLVKNLGHQSLVPNECNVNFGAGSSQQWHNDADEQLAMNQNFALPQYFGSTDAGSRVHLAEGSHVPLPQHSLIGGMQRDNFLSEYFVPENDYNIPNFPQFVPTGGRKPRGSRTPRNSSGRGSTGRGRGRNKLSVSLGEGLESNMMDADPAHQLSANTDGMVMEIPQKKPGGRGRGRRKQSDTKNATGSELRSPVNMNEPSSSGVQCEEQNVQSEMGKKTPAGKKRSSKKDAVSTKSKGSNEGEIVKKKRPTKKQQQQFHVEGEGMAYDSTTVNDQVIYRGRVSPDITEPTHLSSAVSISIMPTRGRGRGRGRGKTRDSGATAPKKPRKGKNANAELNEVSRAMSSFAAISMNCVSALQQQPVPANNVDGTQLQANYFSSQDDAIQQSFLDPADYSTSYSEMSSVPTVHPHPSNAAQLANTQPFVVLNDISKQDLANLDPGICAKIAESFTSLSKPSTMPFSNPHSRDQCEVYEEISSVAASNSVTEMGNVTMEHQGESEHTSTYTEIGIVNAKNHRNSIISDRIDNDEGSLSEDGGESRRNTRSRSGMIRRNSSNDSDPQFHDVAQDECKMPLTMLQDIVEDSAQGCTQVKTDLVDQDEQLVQVKIESTVDSDQISVPCPKPPRLLKRPPKKSLKKPMKESFAVNIQQGKGRGKGKKSLVLEGASTTHVKMESSQPMDSSKAKMGTVSKWAKPVYHQEERDILFADNKFLMDAKDFDKEPDQIYIWQIVDQERCLRQYYPSKYYGRQFFISSPVKWFFFEEEFKSEDFYSRFQPISVIYAHHKSLENTSRIKPTTSMTETTVQFIYKDKIFLGRMSKWIGRFKSTEYLRNDFNQSLTVFPLLTLYPTFLKTCLNTEVNEYAKYKDSVTSWMEMSRAIGDVISEATKKSNFPNDIIGLISKYPGLNYSFTGVNKEVVCSACSPKNRVPIVKGQFSGEYCRQYDPVTFEEIIGEGPDFEPPSDVFLWCRLCSSTLKKLHRLFHFRYSMWKLSRQIMLQDIQLFNEHSTEVNDETLVFTLQTRVEWKNTMFADFQILVAEVEDAFSSFKEETDHNN